MKASMDNLYVDIGALGVNMPDSFCAGMKTIPDRPSVLT